MALSLGSESLLDDGLLERVLTLDGAPGILWTPAVASAETPVPLILLGHPGELRQMHPRLLDRLAAPRRWAVPRRPSSCPAAAGGRRSPASTRRGPSCAKPCWPAVCRVTTWSTG